MQQDARRERRRTYRFVHASNLWLDAPARDVASIPPALRPIVRDASLRAWHAVVDSAIEHRVAFVLLAGGLIDADAPTLRSCLALREGVGTLRANGIDVVLALGDEDVAAAWLQPWLADSVLVIGGGEPATVDRDGVCLAAVQAAADPQRALALQPVPVCINIGVLPNGGGAVAALAGTEIDYWALGGSGDYGVLGEAPWVVSAGTPQGRGLEASQCGDKGCVLVDVEEGRIARVRRTALDVVRFRSVELEVRDADPLDGLCRRVRAALDASPDERSGDLTIAEAVLRGRMARPASRRASVAAELLASLRRAEEASAAPVWWARVRDHTAAPPHTAGDHGLRSILMDQCKALGAPLPRSSFLAQTFAPLLQRWEAESDLAAQRELVLDAAALALDALGGGGFDESR